MFRFMLGHRLERFDLAMNLIQKALFAQAYQKYSLLFSVFDISQLLYLSLFGLYIAVILNIQAWVWVCVTERETTRSTLQ